MNNVTIDLDAETAELLHSEAVRFGVSEQDFVVALVRERMRKVRQYNESMRRFFAMKPEKFEWADGHRPTRAELYD